MRNSKSQIPNAKQIPNPNQQNQMKNFMSGWISKFIPLCGVVPGCLCFVLSCSAQYSIDWFTMDGGGGTSTGSVYSVSGTIGQADASAQPMTGGSYSLTGGFWSLLNVVQTPGAPLLKITLTSTNTAIVSWPSSSSGWNLQQNTNMAMPNWGTPAESVSDNGTEKFITVNPRSSNRFFRLFKP